MRGLWRNLNGGVRLLLFRRLAPGQLDVSADQWVLLAGLYTAVVFALDLARALPDVHFNGYAFSDYALLLLALMLAGHVLGRLWRDAALATAVPVVVISVALPYTVVLQLAQWLWRDDWYTWSHWNWLASAWFVLAALRGFYLAAGRRISRALTGGVAATAVSLPVLVFLGLSEFWQAAPPAAAEAEIAPAAIDAEALLYEQPQLLAQSLAPLQPQRPGVTDSYFVGFAGDAAQGVFAKEAGYARGVWDEHYDSRGRSLLLVNNAATAAELPIASVTNLKRTLRRIGELMDADEDVLALFLTSHGSQDFQLAVNFPPLALNQLTPTELRHALDEAGIKWRIVIVSACYSGGYVAPLQDPYTVVMTAASPERTSFGCDTVRDFTYFGEAYFRDELARGVPLLQSFENAVAAIGEREVEEGLTPSQPQLYVGGEIAARLPQWEAGWRARRCGSRAACE